MKILKICLILFFMIVPSLIALLMLIKVINLENLALGETTKWLASSLLAIPAWVISGLLIKFFDLDENYFYNKLLKKNDLKDND